MLVKVTPHQTLQKYFGYSDFRPGQLEIISSIIEENDTLAILPTGGGKSICFQVPGLIFPGVTLVISPLISLMKDQVDTLVEKNIPATYINSALPKEKIKNRLRKIADNKYKFIYIAPERLQNKEFLQTLQNSQISLIAIDEAHCVSMWGHDFRPSYKKIPDFFHKLSPRPTIAAFTATATNIVQKEITKLLDLKNPQKFTKSFQRDNLTLHNFYCPSLFDKEITLLRLILKHKGEAGIIYTSTRKKTEYLAKYINFLLNNQISQPVLAYHGGMTNEERAKVQEKFLSNQTNLIVATNAFGMGVDKSNIRYVIHYQIPGNLENYYQEAGRAGRDRKPANCYLLYHPHDLKIQIQLIGQANIKEEIIRQKIKIKEVNCVAREAALGHKLKKIIFYADDKKCLQKIILEYFGERNLKEKCELCNNCLNIKKESLIKKSEKEKIKKIFIYSKKLSKENNLPTSQILSQKIIQFISLLKPITKNDFLKIPGIGKGWTEAWYDTIHRYLKKECPT